MRSLFHFREHGNVLPTRTPLAARLGDLAWPVLGSAFVIATLVLAGYLDQRAEDQRAIADLRRHKELLQAFEQGRKQGEADMFNSAHAAWQAAQAEAERCRSAGPR